MKLAGDHVDKSAVERALLRRQARQVQRVEECEEEREPRWPGEEQLWLVAPHVPEWLAQVRRPVRISPGCYRVEPMGYCFVWIAANELPLLEELVPFLVARSGRALDEFCRWAIEHRPVEWVVNMVQYLAMPMSTREELRKKFASSNDPEIKARQKWILDALLEANPQTKQQLVEKGIEKGIEKGKVEGRVEEARAALRRVLRSRRLELQPADEARIEACEHLDTLERWLDQAITASSVAEALG